MKPIINPWMFYLVDCLDGLKMVCIIAVPVLVIVIAVLSYIIEDLGLDIDDLGLNKENELKSAIRTRKIVIFASYRYSIHSKQRNVLQNDGFFTDNRQ